jgi:hypothetical protein
MGIAGLIFGILGSGLGYIPAIGIYVAGPFGLIGAILSSVAISKARMDSKPFGVALAGAILSLAALI